MNVESDSLVVYLADTDFEALDSIIAEFAPLALFPDHLTSVKARRISRSRYSKTMRFVLVDAERRLYCVERWCSRSAIDDWIFLDGPASLQQLVKEYVKHLGKDSFFELM